MAMNSTNTATDEFEIFLKNYEDIDMKPDYRDNLMANLYSTIYILKKELEEKNFVIKSLLKFNIVNCICTHGEKIIETSISPNRVINSSENLIQLSSTVNDPNDNFNYKSPVISPQSSSKSESRDNNEHTSTSHTPSINGNPINSSSNCAIDEQLNDYRIHCHNKYIIDLVNSSNTSIITERNQDTHKWPANTLLIAADSIMSNLDEKKLSRHMNVKVRSFPGSSIADMYSYLQPLLTKEPTYILLHVSTNDVNNKNINSDIILNNILQLKHYIETKLPNATVYISSPTVRTDNHKANTILRNITEKLELLQIPMMNNSNIQPEQLGSKGLHLNSWGNAKIAMNIFSLIRRL